MQKSLKNSLYLGLAVLSLGSVTAISTTANAASKAKVTSDVTLKTAAESRNVEAIGTNALYSKPGTVKGAKRVASKTTMKKMANSKKSADYFRAYRVAQTNRGTVYYKVVSMDGKYRGYIYGGKDIKAFAGGIKSADTTTTASMPAKTTGYHLANANKNGLWTAPKNTQYKAKSISLYSANKTDTFTVSKAETKTREGSLYYYVTDDNDNSIAGWIYAGKGYQGTSSTTFGGLTVNLAEPAATNDNSVNVVYRNNGSQVGNATFITVAKNAKAGKTVTNDLNTAGDTLAKFATKSVPTGYKVANVDTTNATYGNTLYVDVTAAATSKVTLNVESVDNGSYNVVNPLTIGSLSSNEAAITLGDTAITALTGDKGEVIKDPVLTTIANGFNKTYQGTKTYYTSDNKTMHYEFTFDASHFNSDNRNVTYGNNLTAQFTAKLVPNAASSNTVDNSWWA